MGIKIATKAKEGKLLYHVTALENMESILRNGLLSRTEAKSNGMLLKDVANPEIIQKRESLGILGYVPFHFFEKTAFTGAVFKAHPNTTFCTIAISREFAQGNNFKICTAHPLSENPQAEILDYDKGFAAIDWDALEKRDYHNEESKNAGMAECLAISPVLPEDFQSVYVPTDKIKQELKKLADEILGDYYFYIDIKKWCTQEGKT